MGKPHWPNGWEHFSFHLTVSWRRQMGFNKPTFTLDIIDGFLFIELGIAGDRN